MPPPRGAWNPIEGAGDFTTTRKVHNDTYPEIDPATTANLTGKSVFVSGASKGLGRAIAISFAKAGASQIAIGARSGMEEVDSAMRSAASEAGRGEVRVLSLKMDVTDAKTVDAAVERIGREFGKLDVVVNCAGILGERNMVGDSDPESWWWTMNVNLRGPYLVTRACLPLLLKSDLKTLITISSVGAIVVSPGLSHYQTSKLAALRMTEFVAKENAEAGLVAFTVHPGNMLTDIVGRGEGMDDALKAVFTETVELCADGLVFLSKERREWLSGRYVNMTWDLPELTSDAMRERVVEGDLLKVKLVTPELYD